MNTRVGKNIKLLYFYHEEKMRSKGNDQVHSIYNLFSSKVRDQKSSRHCYHWDRYKPLEPEENGKKNS